MAKAGDYTISNIYQGGYSAFKPYPSLSPEETPISAKGFGLTTDPRTANILKEVSTKLSTGVKTIEVEGVTPEIFESIPEDQLEEVKRLGKLTGTDVTLHGPLVEASGMTREGFTESNREAAERQMNQAIERANKLNPDGNIPVTFHSSTMLPGEIKPKGKEEPEETLVINTETGGINRIPLKERKFPGEEEINVGKEISRINEDSWSNQLTNLGYATERASEFIRESGFLAKGKEAEEKAGKKLDPRETHAAQLFNIGNNYLKDSYRQLKELYDVAYKNSSEKEKEVLEDLGKKITYKVNQINQIPQDGEKIMLMQGVIQEGLDVFSKVPSPEIYKPLNDFAKQKTIETFGNVAFKSYDEFGDKAPIISIENPPIGGAFATGEELKEVVEKSKEKFVQKAVQEGVSKSEAKKAADKLIGVTWDVGHINMLRKHGYKKEDIIKETEKVAPLVKHVHLSDNFGFEHTELPMGMGNVPIKEMMKKLGKEGFDGKKIIEAASWWQHFQTPPVKESFEAFGSPIYTDGVGPFWNQTLGLQQGYSSGYGMMLPQVNYQTFGTGFSMASLPTELGGQMPGAQGGRMSGRPME